jgi:hypothetical protein
MKALDVFLKLDSKKKKTKLKLRNLKQNEYAQLLVISHKYLAIISKQKP